MDLIKNKILIGDMEHIFKKFGQADLFNDKSILITGCAGFLGYNFVHFFYYLMQRNIAIRSLILLDNFILGKPEWLARFEGLGDKRIESYNFDISKDDIETIESAKKADFVIHMASIASPTYYRKFPIQTIDANVFGLKRLLEYYKELSLKGFLFFSSSEIYGDPLPEYIPTNEDYKGNVSCMGPRACYDEAKRFGETICYVYANTHNIPISIVRPFNNYGPGMSLNDKRVPADFAKSVLNNEDVIIHSDGMPTRTFCYVSDAIIGYLKALVFGKFDYFNIGIATPEITVKMLADIYQKAAKELLGYNGKIIYEVSGDKNYLTHNPSRRCPDISKAQKTMGFSPSIEVEEGVERFLRYLKEGN